MGVIGGNRLNQQRNEWRGSPPQQHLANDDECDNDLFNANMGVVNTNSNSPQRRPANLLIGHHNKDNECYVNGGGGVFGRWPIADMSPLSMNDKRPSKDKCASSDDDSVDSLICADLLRNIDMNATSSTMVDDLLSEAPSKSTPLINCDGNNNDVYVPRTEDDEELLIANLANLLSGGQRPQESTANGHLAALLSSPVTERFSETSDSSGVSSASDCGSVFGECYSPLVNLGSPPLAFNFPMKSSSPPTADQKALDGCFVVTGDKADNIQPHHQQQHILNCLDMDWYRAATNNRRLLMPFRNN